MLVVFVDDEPGVLNGIERMLFAQKVPWDVYCVPDPEEALELIAREPVDVVVADLKMPRIDGATLLRKVRELHPNAIRIVLSAANDPELLRRSFDIAHAFLAKPCTAPELVDQVERGYKLRRMLEDPALRRLANDVGALPAAPSCYLELTRLLDDPGSNSAGVARVIGRDPALAAKVLQLCNSAFFSAGRPIADIPSAVVRLGFNTIREVVLLTEVYGGLGVDRPLVERSQREAVLAAGLVPAFGADPSTTEMSRTAALLAGIGDLLLERQRRDSEVKRDFGPALGAYLLALWNLPPSVVQAVALREAPAVAGEAFGAAGITHVATHLAKDLPLDEEYLGVVGKLPQVPHWQQALGRLRERVH
jgi:HD-like signal output (HDOD) protein